MKTNMCNMDRVVRAVIGFVLIAASLTGLIGMWGWLGIVLLATAAFRFCPLYAMLGFNSSNACSGDKAST